MKIPDIVIDTNILVSALRSKRGASSRLLSLLGTGRFNVHISVPLVLEYEEVLIRYRKELGLSEEDVQDLVDSICSLAKRQKIYFLVRPFLRDKKDEFVLELAFGASCEYIITYNKRDFRGVERYGLEVLNAREFLEKIGELT